MGPNKSLKSQLLLVKLVNNKTSQSDLAEHVRSLSTCHCAPVDFGCCTVQRLCLEG